MRSRQIVKRVNGLKKKNRKEHDQDFLTRGLWNRSRHPNYFGEEYALDGIATLAGGRACGECRAGGYGGRRNELWENSGGGDGGCESGVVIFLLLKVSGVPLSEKYDRRMSNGRIIRSGRGIRLGLFLSFREA